MWEWLKKLWEDPTQNYVAAYLAGREGDDDGQPKEIEEGKDYFTITLECMRLVNVREGLTKFYGVLSGTVGCDLETRQETITVIVSPEALKGVEKPKLAKVIVQSVPICERVPYSGGPIDLRLALLSLESTNLLTGVVDVLTSFASAAGVAYVEQAKKFVGPIEKGLSLLRSQGGCEIGLFKGISVPRTGYYCVARAPQSRLDLENCRLSKNWELIDQRGRATGDVPYFVLRIEAFGKKKNFARIPSIRDAYARLEKATVEGKEKEANEAFEFFRRTVIWSPDLHQADGEEMIDTARKRLAASFPPKRTSVATEARTPAKLPALDELVAWT